MLSVADCCVGRLLCVRARRDEQKGTGWGGRGQRAYSHRAPCHTLPIWLFRGLRLTKSAKGSSVNASKQAIKSPRARKEDTVPDPACALQLSWCASSRGTVSPHSKSLQPFSTALVMMTAKQSSAFTAGRQIPPRTIFRTLHPLSRRCARATPSKSPSRACCQAVYAQLGLDAARSCLPPPPGGEEAARAVALTSQQALAGKPPSPGASRPLPNQATTQPLRGRRTADTSAHVIPPHENGHVRRHPLRAQ